MGIFRRHAGALRDFVEAELLEVAAVDPDGGFAVLQDEVNDVVFGADVVPEGVADVVQRRVWREPVNLIRGQVLGGSIDLRMLVLEPSADKLANCAHTVVPFCAELTRM